MVFVGSSTDPSYQQRDQNTEKNRMHNPPVEEEFTHKICMRNYLADKDIQIRNVGNEASENKHLIALPPARLFGCLTYYFIHDPSTDHSLCNTVHATFSKIKSSYRLYILGTQNTS